MNTKPFKAFFAFTRQQQNGIFFLLLFIIMLQCVYFFVDIKAEKPPNAHQQWIAFQHQIDSLKQLEIQNRKPKRYPFNPNFISDHKAYTLGMSVAETDRLLAYRKSGKFVNSAVEFQRVAQISDSLLKAIQPWFKFPDWVRTKQQKPKNRSGIKPKAPAAKTAAIIKKDLNTATARELKAIHGIGKVLSERIIKFRKRLGGFLTEAQLYDVYGLKPEVAEKVLREYAVLNPPEIRKLNVNTATEKELASVAYIGYKAARAVIRYRDSIGKIQSLEELTKVQGISVEKIERIELYLKTE